MQLGYQKRPAWILLCRNYFLELRLMNNFGITFKRTISYIVRLILEFIKKHTLCMFPSISIQHTFVWFFRSWTHCSFLPRNVSLHLELPQITFQYSTVQFSEKEPQFENFYGNIDKSIFPETFQAVLWPGLLDQDTAIVREHLVSSIIFLHLICSLL
jgi:hypothetical protein